MKKSVLLLIVFSFFMLGGCFAQKGTSNTIEKAQYYSIFKGDNPTEVTYEIYGSDGKTVFSETTDRPLSITIIDENTVDISKGEGTGLTLHKYYSVTQDKFSQEFSYVICSSNDLIAYIDISEESPLKNRKVVVQNIFNEEGFYKEFQLDFSHVDTPVVNGEFNEDCSELNITYLSGGTQTQITEDLPLNE